MPESTFHVKLAKNDYLTKLVNQVFLVNQAYVYNVCIVRMHNVYLCMTVNVWRVMYVSYQFCSFEIVKS